MQPLDYSKFTPKEAMDWDKYDGRAQRQLTLLNEKISKYQTLSKDIAKGVDTFSKNWTSAQDSKNLMGTLTLLEREAEEIEEQIRANAGGFQKLLGKEGYQSLLKSSQTETRRMKNSGAAVKDRSSSYNRFASAEEYNTAKRKNGYAKKHKGLKTYTEVSDYLNSADYQADRKAGKISDEEHAWLSEYRSSLANSEELQAEIDALELSKPDKSELISKRNELKEQINKLGNTGKGAIKKQELQKELIEVTKQIDELDSKIDSKIGVLKTMQATRKQKEEFEQRWADDAALAQADIQKAQEADPFRNVVGLQRYRQRQNALKRRDAAKQAYIATNATEYYMQYMTDEERATHRWIAKNRGEDKAKVYMDDLITTYLDQRVADAIQEQAFRVASENGGMAALASFGSVFETLGSGVEYGLNLLTGNSDRRSKLAAAASGAREGTKSHWDGAAGEEVWDFLYDTGMSAVDSLAAAGISAVVPYAGEVLLGASAAASKANELLDSGATGANVVVGSLAAGILEAVFERISIGNLESMATKNISGILKASGFTKEGLKQVGAEVGKSIFVNASEELCTEAANIAVDTMLQGDLSQYALAVEQYYNSGMSLEEAKAKAGSDMATQIGMAAASGGLMGLGFGGGSAAINAVSVKHSNTRAGKAVLSDSGRVDTLKSMIAADGSAELKAAAEKLTDKSNASAIGEVAIRYAEQVQKSAKKQLAAALKEAGVDGKGTVTQTPEGYAAQIVHAALSRTGKMDMSDIPMRANKFIGKVYTAFVDEGKYGGKELLTLNEMLIPAKNKTASTPNSGDVTGEENVVDNAADREYNNNRGEGYARTDEFRSLQAESQGMSDQDIQLYHSGDKTLDDGVRERFSRSVKEILVGTQNNGSGNANGLLKLTAKGSQFDLYENVDGELFHDVFEMARCYLKFGELVDLHTVETTEDGIGYNDCYNYLSEDGLSGFSITPDGDLISVFNASGKKGFLRAISEIVKQKAKTLDCYASENQNLMAIYSSIFGFKTASLMDYNMKFDHDNIAENHGSPKIAFMVNTEADVETKHFNKDQYDEAVAYRDSFVQKADSNDESAFSVDYKTRTDSDSTFAEPDLRRDYRVPRGISTKEERIIRKICAALGLEVEFAWLNDPKNPNGFIKGRKVTLNYNAPDPIRFVLKHEITHYFETSKLYGRFQTYVFKESAAFKEWLKRSGFKSLSAAIADAKTRYGDIGYEKLKTEVLADFVGDMLFNDASLESTITEDFLSELAGKDRNLFERFVEWIESLVKRLKGTAVEKDIIKLEQMAKRLKETADPDRLTAEKKHSYAGKLARTANLFKLKKAKERLKNGDDPETIRQETGWFQGLDGKWRFEISDRKMELLPKLKQEGAFIYEKIQLINRAVSEPDAPEELRAAGRRASMELKEANIQPRPILDYVKHDALFKAYPELEEYRIRIGGVFEESGACNAAQKLISINPLLFSDEVELKKTLIHEIQHAVQHIEGFASGADIAGWDERIRGRQQVAGANGKLLTAGEAYWQTAGEIEARDAAERQNMTDKQRKSTRPDIDRDDVVFREKEYPRKEPVHYSLPRDHAVYQKNTEVSKEQNSVDNTAGARDADVRYSLPRDKKITPGMSESERANILRDCQLNLVDYVEPKSRDIDFEYLESAIKSKAEKHLLKKLQALGYIKHYSTKSVDVVFDFTMGGLRKSLHSQLKYGGNYSDLAKVVVNLQDLLDSALLIEAHTDKGRGTLKENHRLKQVYVLLSALKDGQSIIPVQFEIKQFVDDNNRLYLAVALTKIETGVKGNTAFENQTRTNLVPISNISIPELFAKINPKDKKFLKYVPDEFLNATQKLAKKEALAEDDVKYGRTDPRYSIPRNAIGKSREDLKAMVEKGEITLDDAFDSLIDQHGALPKGEKPKVKITYPQKVSDTESVSRYARTVAESGHLDAGMSDTQRREVLKGGMTYQVISDKPAIAKADEAIKEDFAGAVQKWEDIVNSGKLMSKWDIALGERLLQQAAENGNASDTMKYIAELAEMGTTMGQNIQALSLLKKMTGIGQLYYIQRTVNRLNQDLEQKYNGKKRPVQIDPDLAQMLADSKTTADAEAIADDMLKDIADQMPSTFLDKWNAWRYLSMLGNPRTHIRNIVGNGIFVPAIRIKDGISFVGERFISKENRTKVLGLLKPEYRDFARNDFKEMQDILSGGGKMNPSDQIRDQQKVFKNKLLETLRQKNFALMEIEDLLFLQMHYIRALGGALQARGLDVNTISPEQLNEVRLYAVKEAQKATYRDASAVAEALNRFQYSKSKSVRAFGMLMEGVLPFKKTPINILKRGVEYSPIGLLSSLSKGVVDLKKGKITAAEFVDGISAGLTGTGILLLGAFLQSLGWVVGGLDYDDEDAMERMAGAQEYSLQIGDFSYTIDWMAPAVLPFLVGAEVGKFFSEDEERSTMAFLVDSLTAIGEPMTELSMLSGLNDAIEAVAYSDNKITDGVIDAALSYFSQAIPTLGGQIARTADDTRRANYIDKNSDVPSSVQSFYQKAIGKIPGLKNTKIPYIDAWGRTESNGNVAERTVQNFLSPGYSSKKKADPVNEEIARLYVEIGDAGVIPKTAEKSFQVNGATKHLTADEYVTFATEKGQTARQYTETLFAHPMYQSMDDSGKAEVLKYLYSYAGSKAKSTVSEYDYTTSSQYKTAAKLEEVGVDPVDFYLAKVATSVENADQNGSGTVTKNEYTAALNQTGISQTDKTKILDARYPSKK